MPIVPVKDCGGGVNKDLLPSELAPGQWSDCSNVRFKDGFASRRKGITSAWTAPAVTPYFVDTYLVSTSRFVVEAGIARVHVDNGASQTEITRYTDGVAISSITRVGTTATLTTATAHGRTTGNTVTVYECSPSQYNTTAVITVTGATTFTYTMASDPGASATLTSLSGYSYNVTNNFTGSIDQKATGGSFNGLFVLNMPNDGMYYWAGDTSKRLRPMPGLTATKFDAIVFYKNFVIGLSPTISGVKFNQMVMWGSSAEAGALPTTWTAASTNDAGDNPLPAETAGALVDGITFGDIAYLFDQDSIFGMQYVGGNDVFRIFRVPANDGLLAARCVVRTPKGMVYMSNGDVKLHDGQSVTSLAEGRVRTWLRGTLDPDVGTRAFLVTNIAFNEVWVCFPSTGSSTCDNALVWNWDNDTWGVFTIPSLTCGCVGLVPSGLSSGLSGPTFATVTGSFDTITTIFSESEYTQNEQRLIVANASAVAMADTGTTDLGTAISWYLERKGLSLGDEDSMKFVASSRWNFKALAGTALTVYHGVQKTADAEVTWASSSSYTQGTTVDVNRFTGSGRFLAVRVQGTSDQPLSLRSYQLDVKKAGRF